MSCDRARSYLGDRIEAGEVVDARKVPVGPEDLGPWFRGRKTLFVAKGKKFAEHKLKGMAADDRAALVLGPSGKLRAPALLMGDTMVVGYHEELYDDVFGS